MKQKLFGGPFLLFSSFLVASSSMFTLVDKSSYFLPIFILFSCAIFFFYLKTDFLMNESDISVISKDKVDSQNGSASKLETSVEYLLEVLPSALTLIDEQGRITFANSFSEKLLPGLLKVGNHISVAFRSPVFLDAIEKAIAEEKNSQFSFDSSTPLFQHIRVEIIQLPEKIFSKSNGIVIVKFSDQSKDILIDQMRSDFISNASHELRTPLASIIGFIETIQGHAKNDKTNRELFLSLMHEQAERMQRLVDDLLSLSKLELQEKSPPKSDCDLTKVVEKLVQSFQPLAKKYKVKLVNNLPNDMPQVVGDEMQMQQLYSNLIENALKYSGEKSEVNLELIKKPDKGQTKPGMIGLRVRDNGQGIPAEHLYRLTERFYRVSADLSRQRQGTGLGLSIVKHILNRHNGELDIESNINEGSIFTTWLPKSKNHSQTITKARAA